MKITTAEKGNKVSNGVEVSEEANDDKNLEPLFVRPKLIPDS
jgi:hypothetical protein